MGDVFGLIVALLFIAILVWLAGFIGFFSPFIFLALFVFSREGKYIYFTGGIIASLYYIYDFAYSGLLSRSEWFNFINEYINPRVAMIVYFISFILAIVILLDNLYIKPSSNKYNLIQNRIIAFIIGAIISSAFSFWVYYKYEPSYNITSQGHDVCSRSHSIWTLPHVCPNNAQTSTNNNVSDYNEPTHHNESTDADNQAIPVVQESKTKEVRIKTSSKKVNKSTVKLVTIQKPCYECYEMSEEEIDTMTIQVPIDFVDHDGNPIERSVENRAILRKKEYSDKYIYEIFDKIYEAPKTAEQYFADIDNASKNSIQTSSSITKDTKMSTNTDSNHDLIYTFNGVKHKIKGSPCSCNMDIIKKGHVDTKCKYETKYTIVKDFGDYLIVDFQGMPCAPAGPNLLRSIIHKATEQEYMLPAFINVLNLANLGDKYEIFNEESVPFAERLSSVESGKAIFEIWDLNEGLITNTGGDGMAGSADYYMPNNLNITDSVDKFKLIGNLNKTLSVPIVTFEEYSK